MGNVRIIPYGEKRKDFELFHSIGGAGLSYSGFECFNGIWQFATDGVTDITGRPHSGKTEFALELPFFSS